MNKELIEQIYESKKNIIIEGNIATGKTNNIGIPLVKQIIKHNESILILDSKEEYLNKYYNSFKDRGYNTIIINLRDNLNGDGYNFLSYPYKLYKEGKEHESLEFLERIYNQILKKQEDIVDTFWITSANNFLKGLSITLFEDGTPNQININSIINMIDVINKDNYNNNSSKDTKVIKYFKNKDPRDLSYVLTIPTLISAPETKASIITTAYQNLSKVVSDKTMQRFLNKTTFNYKDIITKPTAIFIVTKDEYKELNFIASIFINQLYYMLALNKHNRKFNFLLDNFDTINNIENLNEILLSGISRKIKTTIITKSIKQVERNYGKNIYHLVDTVDINEYEISMNISGKKIKFNNQSHKLKTPTTTYKVNKIKNKPLKIFDISSNIQTGKNEEIDDLIKRIDEKIKHLEQKEKEKRKRNKEQLEKINYKIKELIKTEEKYDIYTADDMIKLEEKIKEKLYESDRINKINLKIKETIEKTENEEKNYKHFNPFNEIEMQKAIEKKKEYSIKESNKEDEEKKQEDNNEKEDIEEKINEKLNLEEEKEEEKPAKKKGFLWGLFR